jgi:hypothetical protein
MIDRIRKITPHTRTHGTRVVDDDQFAHPKRIERGRRLGRRRHVTPGSESSDANKSCAREQAGTYAERAPKHLDLVLAGSKSDVQRFMLHNGSSRGV